MADEVRELHKKVLGLPHDERAALLELLLASFEPKSTAQRAWAELASRRREDVRAGQVSMVPGAEAVERVRAKIV